MMPTEDRIQAVAEFGFTERQARFLLLVTRHAGVCVPRQYARFAGVAYGAKCNAFFDRLVRRRLAQGIECIHNRARLYVSSQVIPQSDTELVRRAWLQLARDLPYGSGSSWRPGRRAGPPQRQGPRRRPGRRSIVPSVRND